jgi:hypothetical protein
MNPMARQVLEPRREAALTRTRIFLKKPQRSRGSRRMAESRWKALTPRMTMTRMSTIAKESPREVDLREGRAGSRHYISALRALLS